VNITVTPAPSLYYIHPDHPNTPRVITNQAQQIVWRWDNDDPFGGNIANENPSGLGVFTCNLRFPGQYFDRETNMHYNYFRDYSPEIGRYIESDPLGLMDGVNTFAYVRNSPLMYVDPTGLACTLRQRVFLQLAVNSSCKWGGTRRCEGSDSCAMNTVKISLNSACAAARRTINQKCFKGGDAGHREAGQDAINSGKRCLELRSHCCRNEGSGND
jgi:RHS repeat-associated protein